MSLGSLASSSRIVSVGLIGGIARRSPVIARQLTSKRFLSTSHSGTLGGGESASYLNKLGNGAASSRLQMPMRAAVAYYNQHPLQRRSFHATNPRNGLPHIAALLAFLKSSYTLSAVQTIGRVTMSLFPIVIFKKKLFQRFLRQMDPNSPNAAIKYERFRRYIEYTRKIIFVLLGIPFGFFWLTVLASSERTPLTGRWGYFATVLVYSMLLTEPSSLSP
ncbi:hypothetical protein FRC03_002036 [Tulasnella sp. 419]|nr:hypothetical protein FRC03_002036 [Tulasnella sp. 419]